jgi:hypothetical protein
VAGSLPADPVDPAGEADGPGVPPAPWALRGQLWMTLFRLRQPVDADRPAGVYAAAFVAYEPGGDLAYSELLVARRARVPASRGRRVTVTDIWVDSVASLRGGRTLWAIPKELADFRSAATHRGPSSTAGWTASVRGRTVASASFRDVSRAAPRTPFRGATWQPASDPDVRPSSARFSGSARTFPCRARWELDAQGPLTWLRGARPLASLRMADFRMRFG